MSEKLNIAGYCRISVDIEADSPNTSIENQKSIITDFVNHHFPDAKLTFFEDRDKSGYTFEQRDAYQQMRHLLTDGYYDILIVKDFSRFSRRNSKGLAELEDLRDAGVRIISINDNVDFPDDDEWVKIQFQFLINEMPVTDTSKKVRSVIKRRQEEGNWLCAAPYGYSLNLAKKGTFTVDSVQAAVVKEIYNLYLQGWGYKKIANHLTDQNIPTPRMSEKNKKEALGLENKIKAKNQWSIVTIQGILSNDFYIGTLRQGKYSRAKINGKEIKNNDNDHIVFENHHDAIIDFKTFALAKEALKNRTKSNYRGVKKYDNVYSGIMECGDCGSPMFPLSRKNSKPAYRCGTYHVRGLKGCTSHYIKAEMLDSIVKSYLKTVRDTSQEMIERLQKSICEEKTKTKTSHNAFDVLQKQLNEKLELKRVYIKQKARDILKNPENEESIAETYDEIILECEENIKGIENQMEIISKNHNSIIKTNRVAKMAIDIFDEILKKPTLEKSDIELLVDRIYVHTDHIHIKLKADIESILTCGSLSEGASNFNLGTEDNGNASLQIVSKSPKHRDKVYGVNIISEGDPLEIYTDANGEVIFKKYSPMGEMSEFTSQYAEVLARAANMPVIITDRDHVISCSGVSKKDAMDRHITKELEMIMENRSSFVAGTDGKVLYPIDGLDRNASVVYPIVGGGDVAGAVILLFGESGTAPGQAEIKLTQVAASFLGKQTEE